MNPETIVEMLDLRPLPDEGGLWSQVWLDEWSSAIYFLLTPDDFSALHRLPGPEVYHHYAGAPVEVTTIDPDGSIHSAVLGDDLERGERPALVVAGGHWQGSRTTGRWSLIGTTMAPAFRIEDFELADRDTLIERHPSAVEHIRALTRQDRI